MANSDSAYGVYGSIEDLSARVTGIPTSTGAIVAYAPRGPVMEPIRKFDPEEYLNTFGFSDGGFGFGSQAAEIFLNAGKDLYFVRVVNGATYAGAYLTIDDPNAADPELYLSNFDDGNRSAIGLEDPSVLGFTPSTESKENIMGVFYAANPGAWNNTMYIRVRPANPAGVPIRGNGHDPKMFYVDIFENFTGNEFEAPKESHLVTRHRYTDANGRQYFIEDVINNKSTRVRFINNRYCAEVDVVKSAGVQLAGAVDGIRPTNDQIIKGWELFENTEKYQVGLLMCCGYDNVYVHRAMDRLVKIRQDCEAFYDVPFELAEVAKAINYRKSTLNLSTYDCALYSGRAQVFDQRNARKMNIPLSIFGAVACAKADEDGHHLGPAGMQYGLISVLGLTHKYSRQGERDALTRAQINYARKLPGGNGYCLWEQLTLQSHASSMQNINVVRLAKYISMSVRKASKVGLFDPQDQVLRDKLRRIAEKFLEAELRQGGLYSYQVICDERNNPNDVVANGDLILSIVADPKILTRQVHFGLVVNATGVRITEG